MELQRKALVLGATGGIGGAIATALVRHGWTVRAMLRDPRSAKLPIKIELVAGDAMNEADVIAAAVECQAIVHAVNPPGYRHWERLVLPMIDNTIAAARAAGAARVVLPGTVYNYNPAASPLITASTPQTPKGRKGAVRVALEERLAQAAEMGVPVLILRAGDFFGPGTRSSWFAQAMVAPGKPLARIVDPAQKPGHSWAYLPDLAEAFALLMERSDGLQNFEVLQFRGTVDASGSDMVDAIRKAAGRTVPVRRFPWWLMQLLGPFGGFPREAAEIEPFWRYPMQFDNQRLIELLGHEPHTPLDVAMSVSLAALDIPLPNQAAPQSGSTATPAA